MDPGAALSPLWPLLLVPGALLKDFCSPKGPSLSCLNPRPPRRSESGSESPPTPSAMSCQTQLGQLCPARTTRQRLAGERQNGGGGHMTAVIWTGPWKRKKTLKNILRVGTAWEIRISTGYYVRASSRSRFSLNVRTDCGCVRGRLCSSDILHAHVLRLKCRDICH